MKDCYCYLLLLFQNVWNRKCTKITSMILMNMKFHFSLGYHHSTYQAWNFFMDTHNMTFQYSFVSLDFTTVRTYHRSVKNNFHNKIEKKKKKYKELTYDHEQVACDWTNWRQWPHIGYKLFLYSQEVEVLLVLYVHEIFFLVCA